MPVVTEALIYIAIVEVGSWTLGLTVGAVPGVLLAAFLVKTLPLAAVRWLVVVVVFYAALMMLQSARSDRRETA